MGCQKLSNWAHTKVTKAIKGKRDNKQSILYYEKSTVNMKKSFKKWKKKKKTEAFEIKRQKTLWQMFLDRCMYRQMYLEGNWETDQKTLTLMNKVWIIRLKCKREFKRQKKEKIVKEIRQKGRRKCVRCF